MKISIFVFLTVFGYHLALADEHEVDGQPKGREQSKFQQKTDQGKSQFESLERVFSDENSKAAPVSVFVNNPVFAGTDCAEMQYSPRGTSYDISGSFLLLTFINQGKDKDQNGLAIVDVPADKLDKLNDRNYHQAIREKLQSNNLFPSGSEVIAKMNKDEPVRKGEDGRSSLFYRRELYPFRHFPSDHWKEYEIREVKRDGKTDYMIKITEKYYQPSDPVKITFVEEKMKVTYCW